MKRALTLLCLTPLFAACATEKIVEKPVPVRVEVEKYVPVPSDLTAPAELSVISDNLTFGEAISLWAKDRATIEAVNGRLSAIASLDEKPD